LSRSQKPRNRGAQSSRACLARSVGVFAGLPVLWRFVIEFAADRAATNKVAYDICKPQAPRSFLAGCMPHTLSHVGEKAVLLILRAFTLGLTAMTHSTNARSCFKRHFDETMQRFNKVRWYVTYEMQHQICINFPSLEPWLVECELWGHAPAATAALRKVITDSPNTFKLELAISVDAFHRFVQATYELEGDKVLCLTVADTLGGLVQHVALVRGGGAGTPNTRAVAEAQVNASFPAELQPRKDARVNALILEQLEKVEPSFVYFEAKLVELKEMVDIFTACRLFDPTRIAGVHADEVERQLKLFPFLGPGVVDLLVADLSIYCAHAVANPIQRDADGDLEYESWWEACAATNGMHNWYEAAIKVLILQPSSAAAERVFSMLKALMGDQQMGHALQDYQEAALMIRYNQLQRYRTA
jgi:hypothetical protein